MVITVNLRYTCANGSALAFAHEMTESVNGKMLLPIWHNLTKQDVMTFSPIIANRKAMTTATMTAKDIAGELALLMQEENTTEE